MNQHDIAQHRLHSQGLIGRQFETAEEVVSRLGAVQAQEYYDAKWALALRMKGIRDGDVEQAFAEGRILRTHVMRPTWHFVTPEDIRWLLKLTAPRVNVTVGSYYRKLEIDDVVVAHSNNILARALQGGKQLMRSELEAALRREGVIREEDDRLRFTFLIMRAELDALICSGARRGKQFTYALLEERVPPGRNLDGDEALAELTRRFFKSHGPATVHDFSWWSGLKISQVRQGLDAVGSELGSEHVEGKTYWFPENGPAADPPALAWLLPLYDEYVIGYKDRTALLDPKDGYRIDSEFSQPIVYAGRVIGSWRRHFKRDTVDVALRPFASFNKAQLEAIDEAVARYSAFLEKPVTLSLVS